MKTEFFLTPGDDGVALRCLVDLAHDRRTLEVNQRAGADHELPRVRNVIICQNLR